MMNLFSWRGWLTILIIWISSAYLLLHLVQRFTKIRIRRFGYLSLRHIDLPTPPGIAVHIGCIGFRLRRPTITRPTWIIFSVEKIQVIVDLGILHAQKTHDSKSTAQHAGEDKSATFHKYLKAARGLTKLASYRLVQWVDFVLLDITVLVKDCGQIQLGMLHLRLVPRKRKVERREHTSLPPETNLSTILTADDGAACRGLEFFAMATNLRFQLQDEAPFEVMDSLLVDAWSEFGTTLPLQNTGVSLKFSKLQILVDDFKNFRQRLRPTASEQSVQQSASASEHLETEVQTIRDDLRPLFDVLTEVQVHIGFLKASYQAHDVSPAGKPLIMTATAKDAVFDVNKLYHASPDYRMLFEKDTIAHQALISLISLTVDMNANDCQETILSVPMLTIALKTSSLAHIVLNYDNRIESIRKLNITTLNTVITSPSSNINALQIPILMGLIRPRAKGHATSSSDSTKRPIPKNNLPRFDFSFGIHDPSIRVVLATQTDKELPAMIIGRLSSFYMEAHASHDNTDYILNTSMRVNVGRLYYHSPDNIESDVMTNNHANIGISCSLLPMSNAYVDGVVDGFQAELSRAEIVDCFARITESFHSPDILPAKLPKSIKHTTKSHPLSKVPIWLEGIKLQVKNFSILISGVDQEVAIDSRGINAVFDDLLIDYGKSAAMASAEDSDHVAKFYKGHLSEILKQDGSPSTKFHLYRKVLATIHSLRFYTVDSGQTLNKKHPMLTLPLAEVAVSQSTDDIDDLLHVGFRIQEIVLGFSLFKVYAVLQALRVLRTSFTHSRKEGGTADHASSAGEQHEVSEAPRIKLQVTVEGKINLVRLKTRLPLDEFQMVDLDHLRITKGVVGEPQVRMRYARMYIDSPSYPGRWDRIVSLRDIQFTRETHTEKSPGGELSTSKTLVLRTDALRIRIPHQFVFYKMLESIINSVKTSTQIIHRFITQTNDYVIAQHPKQAKALPRVRVKARMLAVEVEDDPFESRLGLIFRVGLSEQRMREAREVAFDRKVVKLRESANAHRSKIMSSTLARGGRTTKSASSIRSSFTGQRSFTESVAASEDFGSDSHSQSSTDFEFPEEREKLLYHNSRAWISRIQYALSFRNKKMSDLRQHKWGKDEISHAGGHTETILEISNRPPLLSVIFAGVDLILDKPSFSLDHLPDYIHRVGRGMPLDTQYSLLIPVNLRWKMDEARVNVRDYPLPLLHVPPLHNTQRIYSASWEFSTDLVIAEEFPEPEAIRHIEVNVIPADTGREGSPSFNVEVQRTASSVKTYAEMSIDLNSSLPTRVHWGTSMQPGVGDAMRILDTLSKPQQDPSPKLGFWDKIGLVMHTSMKLSWKHDGDMHITLKGSRDPYVVMGAGAGLTKVFRGNVRWHIGVCPDSRKLMEVMCDEYMLAISDFSRRNVSAGGPRMKEDVALSKNKNALHHDQLSRKKLNFQKILMKLTGDVRWTAGLAFERHCQEGDCGKCNGAKQCRIWDFKPHWLVKLRIPEYSILPGGQIRDAFEGYRSNYIHGQISVTSRMSADGGDSYNTMHLTPKFFAHFFDWIHSFSGNLSLPIRTGPLFPSAEGPKQKLGQHLMTLKYNLQLEPLYLSHVYKSTNTEDPTKIDMTGVKARIDSFTLDLHQRKEERVVTNKLLETQRTSQHMAIYRGQVDLKVTDLRALTAVFDVDASGQAQQEQFKKDPLDPQDDARGEHAARRGDFDVPEEDVQWIDMDDFTELDTLLPETSPVCKIIPLAFAPRFIYDRDTTHLEGKRSENALDNVVVPGQRFGFEKTHYCSMVKDNGDQANEDLGEAQHELWQKRREFLSSELVRNEERLLKLGRELAALPSNHPLNDEEQLVKDHHEMLKEKLDFVENLKSNVRRLYVNEINAVKSLDPNSETPDEESNDLDPQDGIDYMRRVKQEVQSFNNRFIVHDIQMKWNNTLRNVLIRYIQQVNQRRGFSYYMSQKAVRFLSDLVDEQLRNKRKMSRNSTDDEAADNLESEVPAGKDYGDDVERLIKRLLEDREQHFFVPDETAQTSTDAEHKPSSASKDEDTSNNLHEDYEAVNNYILRLIAPQIQLQSEKNDKAVIVLAAQSMQMKILAIKDKTIAGDDVSALVQRKFSVQMTSAQFFYAHQSGFHGAVANLLTQNSYGAKADTYWPPWVPIESVYDFETSPRAFQRIVDRTSALCTYTKNNQLRIKKNDHIKSTAQFSTQRNEVDDRTDSISVNFPKFNLAADSDQYYAMFTIAMDLLIYSEPLQKERNEQIEKILLAADFSDLSGAPEMVSSLQKRIRQLNDFKAQFRLHAQANDPQCKSDELRVAKELEQCEDELFFLMKSVATAQQKHEDRDSEVIPAMRWHLKAEEILWHLMEGKKAFIDFGLSKASFKRTDNSDSSNFNTLEIEMMQGINLSPNPVFAQLFAPYFGTDRTVVDARRSKMVRIYWYMLEAIGGIAVCDHFEVNLFPLRMQMEHDVGKKLFAYVFPDKKKKVADRAASESDSDDDDEDENASSSDDDDDSGSRTSTSHASTTQKHSRMSFGMLKHSASLSRLTHRDNRNKSNHDLQSVYSHETDSSSRRLSRTESMTSLQRLTTGGTSRTLATNGNNKKKKVADGSSDDLTAMMNRANKNMSLVYVKVPSVVLALSYKGAKAKNFVDVTDFVFKMPTIEYRNKTWSYLDLAEHLKREVIKAVLAHTGSLLRDKMTHYRKSKSRQPTLTKQLTSYRTFMPAEMSERRAVEAVDAGDNIGSKHDTDHERLRTEFAMQNRTSTAETTSLAGEHESHSHGLFNNAIGRHIQQLSHIARHKDGLAEDSAESTMKKTRMLLGKFIDKAK